MLTVAQSDYEEKVFLARDLRIKIYAQTQTDDGLK